MVINKSGLGGPRVERITPPAANGVPLPTIVSGGIGALGYELGPDVNLLDVNGLADPLAAHLTLARRGQTGHEKELPPAWIAARVTAPDSKIAKEAFYGEVSPSTPPDDTIPFASQVKWARAALQCPAIADLRHSTQDPLTPGLFLSNVFHSLSRTGLRIPSDPHQAYLRFCGRSLLPVVSAATSPEWRSARALGGRREPLRRVPFGIDWEHGRTPTHLFRASTPAVGRRPRALTRPTTPRRTGRSLNTSRSPTTSEWLAVLDRPTLQSRFR